MRFQIELKSSVGGAADVQIVNGTMQVRNTPCHNPYFPGELLAMPPPFAGDGQIEYEDGTIASRTQMAKAVVEFLTWASQPTHDERKLMGLDLSEGHSRLDVLISQRPSCE